MEKIKAYIKEHEYIFMFLFIGFSLVGVSLCVYLQNGDELWNFQNVYKMYNGYQIYKDANVIITPLFFIIGESLFKILGANIFVFRIYNVMIFVFYYFMTYLLLRKLKVKDKISVIIVCLLMLFQNYGLVRIMANYNPLAMALCMLGIYMLLDKKEYFTFKNILVQAIITFLIILTKQNIGIFYYIALLAVIIRNEKEKRVAKVLSVTSMLGILGIVFLMILQYNNILGDFINYTVIGIGDFAKNNVAILFNTTIIIISVLIISTYAVYILTKNRKIHIDERIKRNLIIIQCFAISMIFTALPIVNMAHFLMAIHIALILLVYIFKIILSEINIKNRKNKILNILTYFIIATIMIISAIRIYIWYTEISKNEYPYDYEEPFWGSIVNIEKQQNIENVTTYINDKKKQGKQVIVFSSKAALYMVPLKESNGYLDLAFYGNTGELNDEEIRDGIRDLQDTEILLEKNTDKLEWQERKELISNLKKELTKVGEIEEFEIYSIDSNLN